MTKLKGWTDGVNHGLELAARVLEDYAIAVGNRTDDAMLVSAELCRIAGVVRIGKTPDAPGRLARVRRNWHRLDAKEKWGSIGALMLLIGVALFVGMFLFSAPWMTASLLLILGGAGMAYKAGVFEDNEGERP